MRVILSPLDAPKDTLATTVVGLISLLAPVYLIYQSEDQRTPAGEYMEPLIRYELLPENVPYGQILSEHIETYLGHARVPLEITRLPVHELTPRGNTPFGQATLMELLFTEHIW